MALLCVGEEEKSYSGNVVSVVLTRERIIINV